jgi:FkbM family methyltransferase
LPSGISEQVIAGGPLRGCKFYLDMQSEKDYWLGTYEVALLESVGKLIQPGWVVYDVGANVGYLTVLFAKLTGKNGKVYAFEPLPANIERLVKNVEANDVKEQVIVCPYAIGDRRDEVVFYLGNSDDTGKVETIVTANEKETKENKDKLIVEMITLDEFAEQNTDHYPQLIKMDIEGAEVLAIKNMQRILQTIKPFMIIEIHSKDAGQVVWNELTKYNYICQKIG